MSAAPTKLAKTMPAIAPGESPVDSVVCSWVVVVVFVVVVDSVEVAEEVGSVTFEDDSEETVEGFPGPAEEVDVAVVLEDDVLITSVVVDWIVSNSCNVTNYC